MCALDHVAAETIADAIKNIPNFVTWLQKDLYQRFTEDKGFGWVINAIKQETENCRKEHDKKKNENLEDMSADNAISLLEQQGISVKKDFLAK